MEIRVAAIIPVRMASTRFPGKPLVDIAGLPMVEHVRRRAALSPLMSDVIVATCDEEILKTVAYYGGKAVMTSNTHERCTDRIAEAATDVDADFIINVQGDEPLVRPEMLESLIAPLVDDDALVCTNLMVRIMDHREFLDENTVKAVCDLGKNAVYFSRRPIPYRPGEKHNRPEAYKQLGIVAFRKDFLLRFSRLPQTPLEIAESVDMLRAIEHGFRIRMVKSNFEVVGVDTPDDLERAEMLLRNDSLLKSYF